jgi:wyosine [tRNA(Phe)-imidazoG37] synthetase (radical SAM superfamily)
MSLGINLMPNDGKICSFDCVYCEAGFNAQGPGKAGVPTRESVKKQLKHKLEEMKEQGQTLDVITFSGNGEPTLHPEFKKVVEDVLRLRTQYFPNAKVSVLSNSTMAGKPSVAEALLKVDNNILKLDSAIPHTFIAINQPVSPNCLPEGVIADLKKFKGQCVVQTIMIRGEYNGKHFDNTTDEELDALLVIGIFFEQIAQDFNGMSFVIGVFDKDFCHLKLIFMLCENVSVFLSMVNLSLEIFEQLAVLL